MIEVGRNSITIRNVDFESSEYKKLRYLFSLYDPVAHKYTFSTFIEHDTDIYIPRSVGIETIEGIFPNKEIVVNYKTTSKAKNIEFNVLNKPRDDIQKQALSFLMNMEKDNDCRERLLSLETGKGKTFVTISAISKYKKKALIIVDTVTLADQWKREFLKHSDIKEDDILILSGSKSIETAKTEEKKIYIAIHDTLRNLLESDMNALNSLMNKLNIGIRVFDEAHVQFKNICYINALSNVEYTIYLTATPSRSNYTDDTLYGRVFRKIPYFNGKLIDNENYHTVIMYNYNTYPSENNKLNMKTKYGFNSSRWASYIANDAFDEFYIALCEIIDKLKLLSCMKIAIILPTIELVEKLKENLVQQYPNTEIGTFIGKIAKKDRTNELEKKIILTNDKIFDKAIDVKDLEVVITAVPISSLVKTEQIIGRLRKVEGKKSILIDMTDNGFIDTIKQQKIRKRFYNKKAKKIIIIDKE